MIPLIVSIDTEEDNWRSVWTGASAENVRELPRLARFLEQLGVRPTYFVNYQVASRPWAAEILRDVAGAAAAEIGAHVHPWNTPPFDERASTRPTMLCNYPPEQQVAKIRTITATIEEAFGSRPTSFRAGRFGLGRETVAALAETGYRVDSSVTPFVSWETYDDGPDFVGAPLGIYRLDGRGDVRVPAPSGPVVEVPLSAGFTRFPAERWPDLASLASAPAARAARLAGIAARSGLVRRSLLSPEVSSVRDMLALSRRLVAAGVSHLQLFFHSSSLRPGLSPMVASRADLDRLYDSIEHYLDGLAALGSVTLRTVSETAEAAEAGAPAAAPAPTPAARERIRAMHPEPAPGRRLLLVSATAPGGDRARDRRWTGFSTHLVRRGWEVHVVSPERLSDVWQGIQVHPGGGPGLRLGLAARALARRFGPNIVVTSGADQATHLAGLLATVGTGTPLVLDLDAPLLDAAGIGPGWLRRSAVGRQVGRLLEDRLFRRAHRVLAANADLAEALTDLHPGTPIAWLSSGVEPGDVPRAAAVAGRGLRVVCAAPPPDGEALEPVLRALRLLAARAPEAAAETRLLVPGRPVRGGADALAAAAAAYGLSAQVEILGEVSRHRTLELVASAGLAVLFEPDQELWVVPELYDAVAAGVPTLVCAGRESATAREAVRLGAAVREPEDIEGVVRLIDGAWRGTIPPPRGVPHITTYQHLAPSLEQLLAERTPHVKLATLAQHAEFSETLELHGRPKANWLWLADSGARDRALELTLGTALMADALRLRFDRVEVLDWGVSAGAPGSAPRALPYGAGSFDFVAVQELWPELVRRAGGPAAGADVAILSECRRILRPGGCLYVAGYNPDYRHLRIRPVARRAPVASLSRAAMRRALRLAGYSRWQEYYVSPSHRVPRTIVPAARGAVARLETGSGDAPGTGVLRRALAAAGLHHVLYPSVAFLAVP